MTTRRLKPSLSATLLTLVLFLQPVDLLSTEWYWVNDFGGTWDEDFGGVTSWRDSADGAGMPAANDDALLVLPYSMSFCNPDGTCFTQPVVVAYRSDTDPNLNELIIESQNMLVQQEGAGAIPDQLALTSDTEIVGGSGRTFTPPPSFMLPDPPGIFAEGTHLQSAGTNTVNMRLVIGGTAGSTGQYELSETGALHVGLFEIVGDEGQGSVTQTGGTHTAGGLIVAQQADSSGSFELSGGSLETSVETIGWFGTAEFHQTGGTHVVDGLLMLGAEADSDGRYEMSGGSLEADSVVVGDGGLGVFSQVDGTVSAREVVIEQETETSISSSTYGIEGGFLQVTHELTVGGQGHGIFRQEGGLVHVGSPESSPPQVTIGDQAIGQYFLNGGVFEVYGTEMIGNEGWGELLQFGGRHVCGTLQLGIQARGDYWLFGGELVAGRLEIAALDGRASFNQTAGTTVEAASLVVGDLRVPDDTLPYDGEYILDDGSLYAGEAIIGSGARGRFQQRSGSVAVNGNEEIGSGGPGRYEQTGGDHSVEGVLQLATLLGSGTYSLESGTLSVTGTEEIGSSGDGVLSQSGGTHTVTGHLVLARYSGSSGTYELSGTLDSRLAVSGFERIGWEGEGTINQRGGTHALNGEMILGAVDGSVGVYNLYDGVLQVEGTETLGVHGNGTFEQFDGTHTVAGELRLGNTLGAGVGTYILRGGDLDVDTETFGPECTFQQYDGHHRVLYSLALADTLSSSADYTMHDGRLEVLALGDSAALTVGKYGNATFTQNGGRSTVGQLEIGIELNASGTYNLSGDGILEVTGDEFVGDPTTDYFNLGVGTFVQDGLLSYHQVFGTMAVGGKGTYELRRGGLQTEDVDVHGGNDFMQHGTFRQQGGSHTVSGVLHLRAAFDADAGGFGGRYFLEGGVLIADDVLIDAGPDPYVHYDDGRLRELGGALVRVGSDSLHNHGVVEMTGPGVAAIEGTVRNHGLFDVTDTTADFDGAFFHHGEYHSTSAESHFESLSVGAEGYFLAAAGDALHVEKDFLNSSQQAVLWDTSRATLKLDGSGRQTVAVPGEDRGDSPAGRVDNFVWGALEIASGIEVQFVDGNADNNGTALYVGVLDVEDRAQIDPENLLVFPFLGDVMVYYNSTLPENDYLDGLTYAFAEGTGRLTPHIPEPNSVWLIISALPFLCGAIRGVRYEPRRRGGRGGRQQRAW